MKKKYIVKMWSNWLEELWDAAQDFDSCMTTPPNCLKASSHTISEFEYITAISPIGNKIKNAETGELANEYSEPTLKELELKGFCVLSFEIDESVSDKTFWLQFTSEKTKSEMSKEEESSTPVDVNIDRITQATTLIK